MNRTRAGLFTLAVAVATLCASNRSVRATTIFNLTDVTNEAQASADGTGLSTLSNTSFDNPASVSITNGGYASASASWSLSSDQTVLQFQGTGYGSGDIEQNGGTTGTGLATFQATLNLSDASPALIHVVGSLTRNDNPLDAVRPDLIFTVGTAQQNFEQQFNMNSTNGTISFDDQVLVPLNSRINAYVLDNEPDVSGFGAGSGSSSYNITMTMLPLAGGNVSVASNSMLTGSGVLNPVAFNGLPAGTLTNNGTVSPGGAASIGAIEYDGAGGFNQASSGQLDIKLDGTGLGNYDVLQIPDGTAALGGTLNVSFLAGFTPQVGDTFDIISADSFTGDFATLNLPALPSGEYWTESVVGDPVYELHVVPEPSSFILAATALGGFAAFALRRRKSSSL